MEIYVKEIWPDKARYTAYRGMTEEQIEGLVAERGHAFEFVTAEEFDAANQPVPDAPEPAPADKAFVPKAAEWNDVIARLEALETK